MALAGSAAFGFASVEADAGGGSAEPASFRCGCCFGVAGGLATGWAGSQPATKNDKEVSDTRETSEIREFKRGSIHFEVKGAGSSQVTGRQHIGNAGLGFESRDAAPRQGERRRRTTLGGRRNDRFQNSIMYFLVMSIRSFDRASLISLNSLKRTCRAWACSSRSIWFFTRGSVRVDA